MKLSYAKQNSSDPQKDPVNTGHVDRHNNRQHKDDYRGGSHLLAGKPARKL
jgi:hypothetical protein